MSSRSSFEQTPIGLIPREWKVVRLGDVVEIHDNKRIPLSEMERSKRKGDYPYCGANGIIDYIDDYIFDGEYVLLAEDGGDFNKFGKSAYLMTGRFWVNNHAHILSAIKDSITNLFLLYVLNFFDLNPYIVGSTRKKLNQQQMKEIKIPLPPLPEQRRIAEILSTVDQAIQRVNEAIDRTERLKRGLMQRLLTRGIGHKEFKDTEIGRIPKEWEILRLDNVLSLKNGERPQLSEDGVFSVYGANGIMGYSENYLVDNDFTIIIGRVGASGEVHLGTGKIWISDNAIYSENYSKDKIYLPWLYYLLKFKQLSHFATKTTHPIITQSFLNSYQISCPPLPEQRRIAEILSTVDKKLELERRRKEKLERIKRGLMNDLLTGKVRVKA